MINLKKIIIVSFALCMTVFAAPSVGDKAVSFSLPELFKAESKVQMKDYDKGVVLLNIWASWCKGCKKEMPFFHRIGKKYQSKNFTVIAVNIDKKAKNAKSFVEKMNAKLESKSSITFVYDKKKRLPEMYEAKAVPFSLLIKNGIIIKSYLGSFDKNNAPKLISDIKAALK